jgi:hypothetical protein
MQTDAAILAFHYNGVSSAAQTALDSELIFAAFKAIEV